MIRIAVIILCLGIPSLAWSQVDSIIREEMSRKDLIIKGHIFKLDKRSPEIIQRVERLNLRAVTEGALELTEQEEMLQQANSEMMENMMATLPDDKFEGSGNDKKHLRGPSRIDSRVEILRLDAAIDWQYHIQKNSASVALVLKKSEIFKISDSLFQFRQITTLAKRYSLCSGEAFENQPVAGVGTAFLVDDNEIITAGHVLSEPADHYALIFGFRLINAQGGYSALIKASDVYFLKSISNRNYDLDLAKAVLDREAKATPLKISKENMQQNDELYMIGHPAGLPLKATVNARILSRADSYSAYTTLDAFRGNSGSPVFSSKTNSVIGILVSGGADFVWTGGCNIPVVCKIPYCAGEKIVLTNSARSISGIFEPTNPLLK